MAWAKRTFRNYTNNMPKKQVIKKVKGWAWVIKRQRYGDEKIGELDRIFLSRRIARMNRNTQYYKIIPVTISYSLPQKTNKKVKSHAKRK